MPTPEQREELKRRYLKELLKVGFDQPQAERIVAEAANRLGTASDPPRPEMGPIYSFHKQPAPKVTEKTAAEAASRLLPQTPTTRAIHVITRKERQRQTRDPLHVRWDKVKRHRTAESGRNAMEVMQEMLAQDMKLLEFTQEDIDYILGTE